MDLGIHTLRFRSRGGLFLAELPQKFTRGIGRVVVFPKDGFVPPEGSVECEVYATKTAWHGQDDRGRQIRYDRIAYASPIDQNEATLGEVWFHGMRSYSEPSVSEGPLAMALRDKGVSPGLFPTRTVADFWTEFQKILVVRVLRDKTKPGMKMLSAEYHTNDPWADGRKSMRVFSLSRGDWQRLSVGQQCHVRPISVAWTVDERKPKRNARGALIVRVVVKLIRQV